jgi:membrane protease YdiL (CAAX protease family)
LASDAASADLYREHRDHGRVPHAGLTFAGWYGFNGGIPAFTVALLGFVLFVGVLTERSRSVWPSVLAHGSWNARVASYFSSSGNEEDRFSPGAGIC